MAFVMATLVMVNKQQRLLDRRVASAQLLVDSSFMEVARTYLGLFVKESSCHATERFYFQNFPEQVFV